MTGLRRDGRWWLFDDGRRLPVIAGSSVMFTLGQTGFRSRRDDGSQTTATWKRLENENWIQEVDTTFRVRFTVQETAGASGTTGTLQLRYSHNGGAFTVISGTSSVVKAVASAVVTDGTATTKQLSGTGTFAAGGVDTSDGAVAAVSLAASGNTEVEYCLQIVGVDVAGGDTIQLEVFNGTTTFGSYTQVPSITVTTATLVDSLELASGGSGAGTNYITASYTPPADTLLIAFITNNASVPGPPTSLSGNGLTWTKILDASVSQQNSSAWWAAGAAPSAGALTINHSSARNDCAWQVKQYPNADTTSPIVQSGHNETLSSVTSLVVTLASAITAGNAVAGAFGHGTNQVQTAGTGYSKLGEAGGVWGDWAHQWRPDGTTTPGMSWATGDAAWAAAVEIALASGAHTVSVGQSAETDTAQAVTGHKTVAVGQPAEADTALAAAAVKTVPVGQAVETDTALGITPSGPKVVPVGQAVETDTAAALQGIKTVTAGQPTETDTAQPITASKTSAIGQAVETDTAQTATVTKQATIGQPAETDIAQPVAASKTIPVGQAIEADTALPVTPSGPKTIPVGQSAETDIALTLGPFKTVPVGQAAETNTALPVMPGKTILVGQAVETDAALQIFSSRVIFPGTGTVTISDAQASSSHASASNGTVTIAEANQAEVTIG